MTVCDRNIRLVVVEEMSGGGSTPCNFRKSVALDAWNKVSNLLKYGIFSVLVIRLLPVKLETYCGR